MKASSSGLVATGQRAAEALAQWCVEVGGETSTLPPANIGGFLAAHPWAKAVLTAQPPTAFCAQHPTLLRWDSAAGGGIQAVVGAAAAASSSSSGRAAAGQATPSVIIVDFTTLSTGAVHNRFDKAAVNDPGAKRALQSRIEAAFTKYATDSALLSAGTVRPTTDADWKTSVQALREQVPGHFWAPVWRR